MITSAVATKTMKAEMKTWDQPNRRAMTKTTSLAIEGGGEWGEGEGSGCGRDMYYRDRKALSRARPRGDKNKSYFGPRVSVLYN